MFYVTFPISVGKKFHLFFRLSMARSKNPVLGMILMVHGVLMDTLLMLKKLSIPKDPALLLAKTEMNHGLNHGKSRMVALNQSVHNQCWTLPTNGHALLVEQRKMVSLSRNSNMVLLQRFISHLVMLHGLSVWDFPKIKNGDRSKYSMPSLKMFLRLKMKLFFFWLKNGGLQVRFLPILPTGSRTGSDSTNNNLIFKEIFSMAILSHSSLITCPTKIIQPLCSSQQDFLVEIWISVSNPTDNKDLALDQDLKQQSRPAEQSNQLMTSQESEWSEEKLPQSQLTNSSFWTTTSKSFISVRSVSFE